jgi:NitT/TauT family transport system ATP-binding protein
MTDTARLPAPATGARGAAPPPPGKVVIAGVAKTFPSRVGDGVRALAGVDLTIHEREFVSLVGPSGCGKSTLLRMIAGLDRPSDGTITIHREDASRAPTGVVFQDYSILPWKTVEANVAFGLRMRGMSRSAALGEARVWIGKLGLTGFERHYPSTLSGGMKQRVAIARALALNPEVLLLDEPFAALDAQLRDLMQEELLAQWEADGHRRSAMLVTHSLDEAILLGDRVVLMTSRPGVVQGCWDVPFPRPRTPEVRAAPEFGQLRDDIWTELRAQVGRALADAAAAAR